ncbi:putative zincin peptidase [Herbinix hemicellulosilytica]|uniref:Putative membrane protein n=1 Tax=Herbinix hemicellulosilytica TaxID=1564487 RepID=A0A0H5SJ11_HERHM|nr:metalloprotease family protein [Herbinix hemicellulosilytica]RBP56710.1 putative zincin peptidase [Herbinix hemicellulosilytica]CRZ35484.1 putative membrane protein [Herbinix hemicellulosilytica]
MVIPGFIISILTFPGVIVHELAHQIFCYLCGIKVIEVKYFQFKNPNGYVIHESTDHPGKVFLTSVGPFIINTLLGCLIILPASIEFFAFKVRTDFINIILVWAGFSILMHAFPSTVDAKAMIKHILKNKNIGIIPKILTAPIIGLIYIGAVGSVFWLDAVYAATVAMLLPNILV